MQTTSRRLRHFPDDDDDDDGVIIRDLAGCGADGFEGQNYWSLFGWGE